MGLLVGEIDGCFDVSVGEVVGFVGDLVGEGEGLRLRLYLLQKKQ